LKRAARRDKDEEGRLNSVNRAMRTRLPWNAGGAAAQRRQNDMIRDVVFVVAGKKKVRRRSIISQNRDGSHAAPSQFGDGRGLVTALLHGARRRSRRESLEFLKPLYPG
jgi:hypothetical protein